MILTRLDDLDTGDGAPLTMLIEAAETELGGHPHPPSGRYTNWIRFVKVDLECEGLVERVGSRSPQRVRLRGGADGVEFRFNV